MKVASTSSRCQSLCPRARWCIVQSVWLRPRREARGLYCSSDRSRWSFAIRPAPWRRGVRYYQPAIPGKRTRSELGVVKSPSLRPPQLAFRSRRTQSRDTPIWKIEGRAKLPVPRKGRYAPPVRKLTATQEIRPYQLVHPDEERSPHTMRGTLLRAPWTCCGGPSASMTARKIAEALICPDGN